MSVTDFPFHTLLFLFDKIYSRGETNSNVQHGAEANIFIPKVLLLLGGKLVSLR